MSATIVSRVIANVKGRQEEFTINQAQSLMHDLAEALAVNSTDSELIKQRVCLAFNVKPEEMCSDRRPEFIAFPRQVAMWMHRKLTNMSLNEIGKVFPRKGKPRDHGTVLHACKRVEEGMQVSPKMASQIRSIAADVLAAKRRI